jgi:hypothetical protein
MYKHVGAKTILNQDSLTEDFFQLAFMNSGDRINGLLNVVHTLNVEFALWKMSPKKFANCATIYLQPYFL